MLRGAPIERKGPIAEPGPVVREVAGDDDQGLCIRQGPEQVGRAGNVLLIEIADQDRDQAPARCQGPLEQRHLDLDRVLLPARIPVAADQWRSAQGRGGLQIERDLTQGRAIGRDRIDRQTAEGAAVRGREEQHPSVGGAPDQGIAPARGRTAVGITGMGDDQGADGPRGAGHARGGEVTVDRGPECLRRTRIPGPGERARAHRQFGRGGGGGHPDDQCDTERVHDEVRK